MTTPSLPARATAAGVAAVLLCATLVAGSAALAASHTRVSAAWSDTSVLVGNMVSVRGTVRPARQPRTVVLQRRTPRGWVPLATRRTRSRSYALRVPTWRPGEFRYRVRVRRSQAAPATATRARSVRVTRRTARGNPRSFSFIGRSGSAVARWNPCKPIGYRVNARLGGPGALADAKRAVARIRRVNGLRLVYRGATRIVPGGRNDRAYPADTQLVVSWARPAQSDHLRRGVAGVGGPSWTSAVNRRGEPDLMIVKGFAVLNAKIRLAGGFGAGPRSGYQGTRGQLLMHEIGHAIGMGHAEHDRWQVLYPTITRKRAVWGAGDLRGMRRLGAARGCLSADRSHQGFARPTWSDTLR